MQSYLYKILKSSLILPIILFFTSCDGIFEKDLSTEQVNIILPQTNYQSTANNVSFKWNELKGVDNFRLQIVSVSFSNITEFTIDTLINNTTFDVNLSPGNYEWRIRGENNSSNTEYSLPRTIEITATSDLSQQVINLYLPLNNSYINTTLPSYSWASLTSATDYDIEIKSGNDFNLGTLVESSNSITNSFASSIALAEGEYTWGVTANNSTSQSATQTAGFTLDLTIPNAPSLIYPDNVNPINTGDAFTYSWNRALDNGAFPSPLKDSVYIYTDPSYTNLYKRFESSTTSKLDSITTVGTYYWRVKTFDEAGNIGSFSQANTFVIQ